MICMILLNMHAMLHSYVYSINPVEFIYIGMARMSSVSNVQQDSRAVFKPL